jgi:stearoyl-CoA desaturase (delta-9 desaturase)
MLAPSITLILVFFSGHWLSSVFCQTFFLHRYGAHRQFDLSPRWERVFHFLTYLSQGASYLHPRGYAILHRMHHAFSDTERDPHSPVFEPNVFKMMWETKHRYDDFAYHRVEPEARFASACPDWPVLDKLSQSWPMRMVWLTFYTGFYVAFAPSAWWYVLLPAHYLMGPIHGAIVNYAGHKLGYRNYESADASRNTLFFDFVTLGELFQNNHHEFAMSPNFAARRFEVDPSYLVIRVLSALGIVKNLSAQRARYPHTPHAGKIAAPESEPSPVLAEAPAVALAAQE